MQFDSIQFLVFFPIVILLYYFLPSKFRCLGLVFASYYFYMSWEPVYAVLIAFTTVITYLSAILIESINGSGKSLCKKLRWQSTLFLLCISANIAILCVFKYGNFILENLRTAASFLGMQAAELRFHFLLPVGISFYTFQAIGYVIDVYRGKVKAEKSLIRYALFISFFPQLVAGPIERSDNLLRQIRSVPRQAGPDYERMSRGFILMLWGFFLKVVISNRAAVVADKVFGSYYFYGTVILLLGSFFFSLQIYCDFAAYSSIAIGAARMMGFDLMENFRAPYFSRSVQEFWKRWHISLSTWFRDYVYIQLGGNRRGRLIKYRNVLATFLLSGLWHGANWTFLAWGGYMEFFRLSAASPDRGRTG